MSALTSKVQYDLKAAAAPARQYRQNIPPSNLTTATAGDVVRFDIEKRELQIEVSDEEIQARLAEWCPPAPRFENGVMAKYAKLVTSAAMGAVTG